MHVYISPSQNKRKKLKATATARKTDSQQKMQGPTKKADENASKKTTGMKGIANLMDKWFFADPKVQKHGHKTHLAKKASNLNKKTSGGEGSSK